MNNQLQNYSFGIGVGFSFVGGGTIGNEALYPNNLGNVFTSCQKSIYTYNKNFALKIQCNNTHNNNPPF